MTNQYGNKTVDELRGDIVSALSSGVEVSVCQWAGQGPMAWVRSEFGLNNRNIESLQALGWSIVQQGAKKRKVETVLNMPKEIGA